jgi:hypothetical protein
MRVVDPHFDGSVDCCARFCRIRLLLGEQVQADKSGLFGA